MTLSADRQKERKPERGIGYALLPVPFHANGEGAIGGYGQSELLPFSPNILAGGMWPPASRRR